MPGKSVLEQRISTSRKMTSQVGVDFSKSSFLPHCLNKSFASSVVRPREGEKSIFDRASLSSPISVDFRTISVDILLICLLITMAACTSIWLLLRLFPTESDIAMLSNRVMRRLEFPASPRPKRCLCPKTKIFFLPNDEFSMRPNFNLF